MSKCRWVIEQPYGEHVLIKNGKECCRIKEGQNIKFDEGRLGASIITFHELRADMEMKCGCTEMEPDSEIYKESK